MVLYDMHSIYIFNKSWHLIENNLSPSLLRVSVRWSSRPWTRRATPTCRGSWSRVRRPREEQTPSTRPLFSNIQLPCPLLCVCAFQKLACTGAPPRSWARATHAAASPHQLTNKNKTSRPAPPRPQLAEPAHCMMTFGAALSLSPFSLSPPLSFVSAPPRSLARAHPPACRPGAWPLNPGLCCTSLSPPVGEMVRLSTSCLWVSQQSTSRLLCFQFSCGVFFFLLLMGATVWLCLAPPFFILTASIPRFSLHFSPFVNLRCDSVLAVH